MHTTHHGDSRGPIRNDFTPTGRLRAEQVAVAQQIEDLAALAAQGKADGTELLPELAKRKAALDQQLAESEADARRRENLETQRKLARLPEVIREARAARTKFIDLYRATCAALGDCARLAGEALELTNLEAQVCSEATGGNLYYSPHRNELAELALPPRPLEGFAHGPVTHIGYDWRFPIVPVHANIKEEPCPKL